MLGCTALLNMACGSCEWLPVCVVCAFRGELLIVWDCSAGWKSRADPGPLEEPCPRLAACR